MEAPVQAVEEAAAARLPDERRRVVDQLPPLIDGGRDEREPERDHQSQQRQRDDGDGQRAVDAAVLQHDDRVVERHGDHHRRADQRQRDDRVRDAVDDRRHQQHAEADREDGLERHLGGAELWAGRGLLMAVSLLRPSPASARASSERTAARSSAPATSGSRGGCPRAGVRLGPGERALQVHPRLVEALELDVGATDEEVGEPEVRIVAQAPLEQGDRLVEPAVAPGDGGEPRDRQREGAVLQRRLLVVVGGLGGAPGGLGQRAEPLLRRAESGGDRARPLEGRRRPGLVAAAEKRTPRR